MRAALLLAVAALAGCGAPDRAAGEFTASPEAARAVVAACDAGRRRSDCEAARAGLAEARRRERMAAYEKSF
jgi:hypothetical protein